MNTVTNIKLLKAELEDLQRLIDVDSQLLEKYPEDDFLRITLQQYLDRRTTLSCMLRDLVIHTPQSAIDKRKISTSLNGIITIDEKQMNELKIRTVM